MGHGPNYDGGLIFLHTFVLFLAFGVFSRMISVERFSSSLIPPHHILLFFPFSNVTVSLKLDENLNLWGQTSFVIVSTVVLFCWWLINFSVRWEQSCMYPKASTSQLLSANPHWLTVNQDPLMYRNSLSVGIFLHNCVFLCHEDSYGWNYFWPLTQEIRKATVREGFCARQNRTTMLIEKPFKVS